MHVIVFYLNFIIYQTLELDLNGDWSLNICTHLGPVKTNVSFNALSGDGTKFGKTDKLIEQGMSVQRCVELILHGGRN